MLITLTDASCLRFFLQSIGRKALGIRVRKATLWLYYNCKCFIKIYMFSDNVLAERLITCFIPYFHSLNMQWKEKEQSHYLQDHLKNGDFVIRRV